MLVNIPATRSIWEMVPVMWKFPMTKPWFLRNTWHHNPSDMTSRKPADVMSEYICDGTSNWKTQGISSFRWPVAVWNMMSSQEIWGTWSPVWSVTSGLRKCSCYQFDVLLVKIALGRELVNPIYHHRNLLLKGFLQTPLLINQPMGKGHLWGCKML